MTSLKFSCLALVFLFAAMAPANAIPNHIQEQNMAKAPEVLELLILRVDTLDEDRSRQVEIHAEITGVRRTAANHAAGQNLRLSYRIPLLPPTVKVNPFAVPEAGRVVLAYLRPQPNGTFRPKEGTFANLLIYLSRAADHVVAALVER